MVVYTTVVKEALHHCQPASVTMSVELTVSWSTCFTSSHDLSVDQKLIESQRDDIKELIESQSCDSRHLVTQSVIDAT